MLCLSGLELYSRWVPLKNVAVCTKISKKYRGSFKHTGQRYFH